MSIKNIVVAASLVIGSHAAQAQKQRTVIDGDTGHGLANVTVMGRDFTVVTDSMGRYTLPHDCKTLLFSHINYTSYLVNLTDLGDSVALFSKTLRIDEVTVMGKPTGKDPLARLNKSLRMDETEAQLRSANPNGNLLGLLSYLIPKKWRKSSKQRRKEKLKKTLEEY